VGQPLRQRLVQVHAHPHASGFGGHFQAVVHLVIGEGQLCAEAAIFLISLTALQLRDLVPLLWSGHQAYIAVGGDALTMKDHLHAGVLLVGEDGVESAVVENDAEALRIQVTVIRHLHSL
jgi:hypothetical protein